MKQRITENGITVISPDEGYALTNGEIHSTGEIFLGKNSDPGDWTEETLEAYEAWLAAQTPEEA